MALTQSREIYYVNFIERLEHITGKKVLSWHKVPHKLAHEIYFTDKTMLELRQGDELQADPKNIEYKRIPASICVSCGEDAHASTFDRLGRCSNLQRGFWSNVRKVYWHRYLKSR